MATSMGGGMGMGAGPTGRAAGLKGTGYKQVSMPSFTPEQMQLYQSMFGQVGPDSYLSKLAGGDQSSFEQLEAPAMKQFAGLQGQLASRFSGMGSGARRSSGFQNTANQATADFAQQLQSQRMGLQRQAMMDLSGMRHQLLGERPYEQFLMKKQPPWWQSLLTSGAEAGGQFVGNFAGNAGQLAALAAFA